MMYAELSAEVGTKNNQKMHFLKEIPVHEMQKLRKKEEKSEEGEILKEGEKIE